MHEKPQLLLHYGDLTDGQALTNLVLEIQPDEIYNLGRAEPRTCQLRSACLHADERWCGALNVLEAARLLNKTKPVRVYQASSSEMYGMVLETPQKETTPFNPQSPYACAKVYAFFQTINYRRSYDLFACNGILFNHESPRRGETFVTRKITRAATRIKVGLQKKLYLRQPRCQARLGLCQGLCRCHVAHAATRRARRLRDRHRETRTIREFLDMVFGQLELDWNDYVEVDPRYFRPAEVDLLLGDATKAKTKLAGPQPPTSAN